MGVINRRGGSFVIHIDPILCDGYGHCHELAPEDITIDEWGYPVVVAQNIPLKNHQAYEAAKYAERGCPRQAIRVEKIAPTA